MRVIAIDWLTNVSFEVINIVAQFLPTSWVDNNHAVLASIGHILPLAHFIQ